MGKRLKNSKKRKYGKIIVLILLVVLMVGAAGVYFGFRVTSVTYAGSKHYSDDELNELLFNNHEPNALIYTLFGDKDKEIPFIQKYDVEVEWPNKMDVTIYEKAIVGYISYMGCNMYFDKDGMVVESSAETYEGVPEISGLVFKSIVLDSKLDVGNDNVFDHILKMTQSFSEYNLGVDKVYFDTSYNATLYIGDVKVILGEQTDSTEKLYALKQMKDKLTGLKGTLYLDSYNGTQSSIIFKKEN